RLGLHPLALEDVLNVPQRPKVERFDKYVFVILRTMRLERRPDVEAGGAPIIDEQVSLFFGTEWVVTIQERADGDSFGTVRDAIAALLRDDSPLITAETKVFLRDVYDHAIQALEIVETLRETAVSVMELFLSAQNQRLNEVMKVLTVIATLFIPLTTIASIYGMNFKHMPELEWRYGYAWALGLMLVTALAMLGFFKRKGWW